MSHYNYTNSDEKNNTIEAKEYQEIKPEKNKWQRYREESQLHPVSILCPFEKAAFTGPKIC